MGVSVLVRVLAGVVVIPAGWLVGTAGPVVADCPGPTVEYDAGRVDRGSRITVTGTFFGDDCHDTGPPPAGEDTLGRPLTGIEVVVVQDGTDHLVARGDADADYGFEVDVVVPLTLEVGEARLEVRSGGRLAVHDRTAEPLVISTVPPAGDGAPVAQFGPDEPSPDEDRRSRWPVVVVAGLAGGAVLAAVLLVRRWRGDRPASTG